MKKRYIALILIVLFFLMLGCIGSSGSNNSDNSKSSQMTTTQVSQDVSSDPLTILDSKIERGSIGEYYITGTAQANKDLTYAEVTAKCYDANGAVIGSYIANMQNLKKGEKWSFKIIGPMDENVKVAKYTVSNGNSL